MKTLFSILGKFLGKILWKILGFIATHPIITIIAALVIGGVIVGGLYFGNSGDKPGMDILSSTTDPPVDPETPPENPDPEIDWTDVKQLNILIKDDKVFVNDIEFEDAENLQSFLEEIYDDGKIVRLDDTQSILATRDWVVAVLDNLNILYTQLAA